MDRYEATVLPHVAVRGLPGVSTSQFRSSHLQMSSRQRKYMWSGPFPAARRSHARLYSTRWIKSTLR